MIEMEDVDAAYTLRRQALAARLAWRLGDVDVSPEAVLAGCAAAARLRHCGFRAHEGYAGLGDTLLALRRHERERGGAVPPLDQAWSRLQPALAAHVRALTTGVRAAGALARRVGGRRRSARRGRVGPASRHRAGRAPRHAHGTGARLRNMGQRAPRFGSARACRAALARHARKPDGGRTHNDPRGVNRLVPGHVSSVFTWCSRFTRNVGDAVGPDASQSPDFCVSAFSTAAIRAGSPGATSLAKLITGLP